MASNKPTMILQSRTDMSKNEITALSDGEAWKLIYSIRTIKTKDHRLLICFTGFGTSKKQELIDFANDNKFKVVSSVTKKLDYLCGGENAGPKKIEKAESQGVQFLCESQFINLVQTDEIPNET